MSFILDTNALSEPQRPWPDPACMAWLVEQAPLHLYTSVLCVGEIQQVVSSLPPGAPRDAIEGWLAMARTSFGPRIIAVDIRVAGAWAAVMQGHRRNGLTITRLTS